MLALTARPVLLRPARLAGASRRSLQVHASQGGTINPSIKKEEPKVVDTVDTASFDKKAVFCRCWRSKKFPYCDGAHMQHNKDTGDNVGPLIVEKK